MTLGEETEQLKQKRQGEFAYLGELSLNGKIRACTGILPMTIAAKKAGIKNIIVPLENLAEASLVKGIQVFGFDSLYYER